MPATARTLAGTAGVAGLALATALAGTVPSGAATASTTSTGTGLVVVGRWMLDEEQGATWAHDVSGNEHEGSIGAEVQPGAPGYYETAFRFTPPAATVKDPERLVTVPDAPDLDPGWRTV